MDDNQSSNLANLQQRLEESERNAILAATYGKQLLEENQILHIKLEETVKEYATKVETLEQEKHCISLKLEAKMQLERSLSLELEQLREKQNHQITSLVSQTTRSHEQEVHKYMTKVSEMEEILDQQRMEINQNNEQIALLQSQVKETQERLDSCNFSFHEQSLEETTATMQNQIMSLTCEKQELEMQVSSLNAQIKTNKHTIAKADRDVARLTAELEEKECQCTSYYNALEKSKEDMQELKMEIESLRLAEIDPARKGNSLFAEVEDNRKALEQHLLSYKANYNILKKECGLKAQQISKMKLQLASLLSLSCNRTSAEHLSRLEESLASARAQLEKFMTRCQELETQQTTASVSKIEAVNDGQDMNSLFTGLYSKSQKQVTDLQQKLQTAEFDKVVLSDRALQLQRQLRRTEVNLDAAHAESIRLSVRLEEMATKAGEKMSPDFKEDKRVVQKIPDFEKFSPIKKISQVRAPETIVPLKKKLMDPTVIQIDKQAKIISTNPGDGVDTSSSNRKAENQENELPLSQEVQKKRKKLVRMTETVAVQNCDGEVKEIAIKLEDGNKKVERKEKVLRKMEAPIIKVTSKGQSDECKQQ